MSYRIDQADEYTGSIFDLETTDETVEAWDNAFYVASETRGQPAVTMSIGRFSGTFHLGANALSPGITEIRYPDEWGGRRRRARRPAPARPQPVRLRRCRGRRLRADEQQPAADAGGTTPVEVPERHRLGYQLFPGGGWGERSVVGDAADLGASEAG